MARLLSRTCHSGSGTYMPILVAPTLETCLAHYQSSSFGSFALKLWHSELVLFSVVAECNMCTMNHPFYCLNGRKKKKLVGLYSPCLASQGMVDGLPVMVWPGLAPAAVSRQAARSWERARGSNCSHYRPLYQLILIFRLPRCCEGSG